MYELVEEDFEVKFYEPHHHNLISTIRHMTKEISDKLIDLCKEYNGIGLSANQVGLPVKCCVMMTTEGAKVFFNPELKDDVTRNKLRKKDVYLFPTSMSLLKDQK